MYLLNINIDIIIYNIGNVIILFFCGHGLFLTIVINNNNKNYSVAECGHYNIGK